jgi:hypothetical protein
MLRTVNTLKTCLRCVCFPQKVVLLRNSSVNRHDYREPRHPNTEHQMDKTKIDSVVWHIVLEQCAVPHVAAGWCVTPFGLHCLSVFRWVLPRPFAWVRWFHAMSLLSTGLTPLVFVVWQYIRNILDLHTHYKCNFSSDMLCPWTCGGRCDAHIGTVQTTTSHEKKHQLIFMSLFFFFFFRCGAATQRGSWPPHSWGF